MSEIGYARTLEELHALTLPRHLRYTVTSDPVVDAHGEDGWYARAEVEVEQSGYHGDWLMLVLGLLGLLVVAAIGALAIIGWVVP